MQLSEITCTIWAVGSHKSTACHNRAHTDHSAKINATKRSREDKTERANKKLEKKHLCENNERHTTKDIIFICDDYLLIGLFLNKMGPKSMREI